MTDEKNPKYALQTIDVSILLKTVNGEINLNELAKMELESRGLDKTGKWIGTK